MPNGDQQFPRGDTRAGLERIRTRLLDLTTRNRLLSFKTTKRSTLRFVDLLPGEVFDKLTEQEEKLVIEPVPDPPLGSDAKPEDHAKNLGWSVSYDLPRSQEERGIAPGGTLPTLKFEEDLSAIARHISRTARTAIDETGANMLFLVFGFLHWYETDQDEQERFAPLVVVPVSIQRDRLGRRGERICMEYTGEDVADNLSLRWTPMSGQFFGL